jgi:TonB family protein
MISLAALVLAILVQAPAQTPVPAPVPTPLHIEPLSPPTIAYPADAKAARISGTVHLEINVDPTGKVTAVKALDGPTQLRQAAIDAYSRVTYAPLLKNNIPTPAIVSTAVNFTLAEAPPDNDMQVNAKFQPLHTNCQQLSLDKAPTALDTCRQALAMSQRFTPGTELEARATAFNDVVLLLIAGGKYDGSGKRVPNPNLPEAGLFADQAVDLVNALAKTSPHKPAVATAYITRAEVRSLAGDLRGSAADCSVAEDVLNTILQDQAKRDPLTGDPAKRDEIENERAGNYRVELRDTYLLHAIVLERDHKGKEAKLYRNKAEHI